MGVYITIKKILYLQLYLLVCVHLQTFFFALFYAQYVQHLCTAVLTVYQICVFETSEICHMAAFTYQS